MRLDLRHEVDRARRDGAVDGRIDPVEVVEGEDDTARARHAFRPVVADRREDAHERLDREATGRPDGVDPVHATALERTSCSIRDTTSSTSRSVVSICTASAAGCMLT